MASAYEIAVQGPSVSFWHKKREYTLTATWTDELLAAIVRGKLVTPIRILMGSQWQKWKIGKKRADLIELLKDSFATLGIDGQSMLDLLGALSSDTWCRAFQYDLIKLGYRMADTDFHTMCLVYEALPEDSRLRYVMEGRKPADWTTTEYMLADLVDLANYNVMMSHVIAQVNGLKSDIKAPKSIYKRPYEVEKEKVVFSQPSELKNLLMKQKGLDPDGDERREAQGIAAALRQG